MKGKQLSLEEVLNLEDGSKVWVEELDEEYRNWSQVYTINKEEKKLYTKRDEFYRFDAYCFEDNSIEFYEWIDEQSKVYKMSVEICNLRGLDLTDDNIEIVIKEFS